MLLTPEELAAKYVKPKNPHCQTEAALIKKIQAELAGKIWDWHRAECAKKTEFIHVPEIPY